MLRKRSTGKGSTPETPTEWCLSVFAPECTDNSDSRPSRYGGDAPAKLRRYLEDLFADYKIHLNIIMVEIVIEGDFAYDYGWHELSLTPLNGGESRLFRKRYLELWRKQKGGVCAYHRLHDGDTEGHAE